MNLKNLKIKQKNQKKKKKKRRKMQYKRLKHFTKHEIWLLKFLKNILHWHLMLDINQFMEKDPKY